MLWAEQPKLYRSLEYKINQILHKLFSVLSAVGVVHDSKKLIGVLRVCVLPVPLKTDKFKA